MAEKDTFRGCLKNNPSSVWGQSFASLASNDLVCAFFRILYDSVHRNCTVRSNGFIGVIMSGQEIESHDKEVEALKKEVKNMLLDSTKELADNIQFINLLCRLGVFYHFEDEIEEQLNRIFSAHPKVLGVDDYDLSTLANLFRILRQYGYTISSDIFKKFKGGDGEFKKEITNDFQGMLFLYEACFLAIPGDHILEEALSFPKKHLEELVENPRYSSIGKHIRNALKFPSHRTPERLDALNYISFYEEYAYADETLLKFAKTDYNRLQLLYRKEIVLLTEWWINTGLIEKVPYARDRMVESYMWSMGSIFEPKYSFARIMISKYTQLVTVMDDTYDSYGTMDELKLFTEALQKFTIDDGEELPEYMKFIYRILFEDLETNGTLGCEDNISEKCSYKISFLKEMVKELARAYLLEAHWQKEKIAPSFDDYTRNGKVTSTFDILTFSCVVGMENIGIKEILWLRTNPEIVIGAKLVARFINDIAVRKDETNRGDFPKVLDCYTEQYGVLRDVAFEEIVKLLDDKWKRMNEDLLKYSNIIPRILLKYCLNYARLSVLFYAGTDLFTYPSKLKELVESMLIEPIPM